MGTPTNFTTVVIGDSAAATFTTDAILEIAAQGAILFPRLTTTQRDALTGTAGMVIWNQTTGALNVYDGTAWLVVSAA